MVRLIPFALVALALISPAHAWAQSKLYVAADVGKSDYGLVRYQGGVTSGPNDLKSEAFKLRFGYQFVRWVAIEGSYARLGDYSSRVTLDCGTPGPGCPPDFTVDEQISGFSLQAVGSLPIGEHFVIRAQVGAMLRLRDAVRRNVDGTRSGSTAEKLLPAYGFTVGVPVNDRLEINANWARVQANKPSPYELYDSGELIQDGDVRSVSLGVRWRF